MSSVLSSTLFCLLAFVVITARSDGEVLEQQWCVADEQMTDDVLQRAIDWACSFGGADCSMVQPGKPCYLPNTVKSHASYVFNSYWQRNKHNGGSCYFNSAAMVTDTNPSYNSCHFESLS